MEDKFKSLYEANPLALFADGFEDAYIGHTRISGDNPRHVAVYSRAKCIAVLIERDGMSHEDAEEFFEFNVEGSHVGVNTPLFLEEVVL